MNSQRGILVAGNWKMNHGIAETEQYFAELNTKSRIELKRKEETLIWDGRIRVGIFPSFLSLKKARILKKELKFPIFVGAQNAHWELKGAFTGEVSGPMLKEIRINWVLLGHSERRHQFGETDAMIQKRATGLAAQEFNLILCIGETLEEREANKTQEVLARQIQESLPDPKKTELDPEKLVLAYEPVWAIGTGRHATASQAQEAHDFIRRLLIKKFGHEFSDRISILYGGSVTPENASSLLGCADVDGLLVGGASLKPDSYLKIIKAAATSLGKKS